MRKLIKLKNKKFPEVRLTNTMSSPTSPFGAVMRRYAIFFFFLTFSETLLFEDR